MQHSTTAENYDLESVTARLEAMKARRGKWLVRKNADSEKQQLSERETTRGFELAPADVSSGGSEADSDDGYQSSSTNSLPSDDDKAINLQISKSRGRARKLRVTDSLELSMSVATSRRSLLEAETMRTYSSILQATYSKLPGEDATRRLIQRRNNDQAFSYALPEHTAICKPSRIPKLVQKRRQLQGQRAITTGGYLETPMSAVSSHTPTNRWQHKTPSSGDRSAPSEASKKETLLHSTKSPTRDRATAKKEKTSSSDGASEEIGSITAEEQRLLRSLEKLDRRLSTVSNSAMSVREDDLKVEQSQDRNAADDLSTVRATSEKADCNSLRAAANDGKIRQPSSVCVRSSSKKRAELSSGFHKSRVRVAGALVNETRLNNHTSGSGKDRIVVKKDLAHLLF
ncbi:hypothetical protein GN958_ATG01501 [Phytophthora infestans]|uniref:Uncharacterized protein n=1 Tax=Phytophthora infestans TaxID=4787 RepID=A0A8S9V8A4_PHYIN|nr:hypothetical protein GN958_ATG01501 [Phytophthora infestans]